MADVFISYKRDDRPRVEVIAQKLQAVGLDVWFDTRLTSGPSFDETIAREIRTAKVTLACWTPEAIASEWVRAEAAMAHTAAKLVACFLEPADLIPPFNLVHAESLADWNGEDDHAGWAKLLTRLCSFSTDEKLVNWSRMMSEGQVPGLRKWIASAPPGPLRSTTRFWLSEADTSASTRMEKIAGGKALKKKAKRKPWGPRTQVAVGVTVIVALFALWQGYDWLARNPLNRTWSEYDVTLTGSAEGLYEGSDVRFVGITVGQVDGLMLDRMDSSKVIARIRVDAQTPVRTDSVAMRKSVGMTGQSIIDISAGSPDQPLLSRAPGDPRPVIPALVISPDDAGSTVPVQQQDIEALRQEIEKLRNAAVPAQAVQGQPARSDRAPSTPREN